MTFHARKCEWIRLAKACCSTEAPRYRIERQKILRQNCTSEKGRTVEVERHGLGGSARRLPCAAKDPYRDFVRHMRLTICGQAYDIGVLPIACAQPGPLFLCDVVAKGRPFRGCYSAICLKSWSVSPRVILKSPFASADRLKTSSNNLRFCSTNLLEAL